MGNILLFGIPIVIMFVVMGDSSESIPMEWYHWVFILIAFIFGIRINNWFNEISDDDDSEDKLYDKCLELDERLTKIEKKENKI